MVGRTDRGLIANEGDVGHCQQNPNWSLTLSIDVGSSRHCNPIPVLSSPVRDNAYGTILSCGIVDIYPSGTVSRVR